jgi:hypothetical protein
MQVHLKLLRLRVALTSSCDHDVARRRCLGLSWPLLKNAAVTTDCVPATRPSLHRRGVDHAGAVEAVAGVQKPGDVLIVFRPQLDL